VWADKVHPGDRLICNVNARRVPTASDCLTAIEMFPGLQYPTGPFISRQGTPAPDPNKPISLELDKSKYALPATFRSGNCFVNVGMERQTPDAACGPHTRSSLSDVLYFKIWPLIQAGATELVQRCVDGSHGTGIYAAGLPLINGDSFCLHVKVGFVQEGSELYQAMVGRGKVYNASKAGDANPDPKGPNGYGMKPIQRRLAQ